MCMATGPSSSSPSATAPANARIARTVTATLWRNAAVSSLTAISGRSGRGGARGAGALDDQRAGVEERLLGDHDQQHRDREAGALGERELGLTGRLVERG